jgi:leucyl/phenylalanyl-tRNA--protein transferase
VLPLDLFHVPKTLARRARQAPFAITSDQSFEEVMRACSEPAPGREQSWIDERLVRAYVELHERGHAHSIEARLDGELVGGLYGVHLGGAFFGESMFSRPGRGGTDASKLCLVELLERMKRGGFALLDTQFWTPHLGRFGCIEIPRARYMRQLASALALRGSWPADGAPAQRE